ncbi:MAG: hypothetical protein K2X63_04880, partial [Burkholderiaceae bacterium]|nr:hypothetical protein [Burkholderiaceae bacterium]
CFFLLPFVPAVQAQTMFKCGGNYQDRPCATGQPGKVIGNQKTSANKNEGETKIASDASCKRRGEVAKRIIWAREGGAQKDELLAKASNGEESKLIADIYAVRGNSNDIRADIERDCMTEKTVYRQPNLTDPALIKAAKDMQEKIASGDQSTQKTKELITDQELGMPAKKRLSCPNLKLQLEIVTTTLKAGANPQASQQLNQQKRDLEKDMTTANCR